MRTKEEVRECVGYGNLRRDLENRDYPKAVIDYIIDSVEMRLRGGKR